MRFDVLTLFPEIFQGYLTQSILKLALDRGLVEIDLWNLRDWAQGKHKSVDDRPFGGGPGMVLMPEPVFAAVEDVQAKAPKPGLLIMLTPSGQRLTQDLVKELSKTLGGRGGGKPELAQAGGGDPAQLDAALAKAYELV